jgi:TonB family protein
MTEPARQESVARDSLGAPGNIIPFRLTEQEDRSDQTPPLRVAESDRPAPPWANAERRFDLVLILIGSLIGHAALFGIFRTDPEAMASIDENAITVEIIVGADAAAGTAQARSDAEPEQQSTMDVRPDEAAQEKPTQEETKTPPETPMTADEESIAPVQQEATPPERNVEETRPEPKPKSPAQPKAAPSRASAPANSIGRGQMAGDANYQGIVAARLARFKRFPTEARRRREQGSALVSFVIEANGRVMSVRLVRGTGFAALDEEVQEMVRRASPFPPPPKGAAITFSAPVSFHLN